MKEYIEQKAAEQAKPEFLNEKIEGYEKAEDYEEAIYAKGWNDCITQYRENILSIPAADVVEIKHGWWIFNPKDAIEMMFTLPKCSECGVESPNGGKYCPNCGAKMDEVEE